MFVRNRYTMRQDPADPWCWCIKFKTPTESFFRDIIFVKWTWISHTVVTVYLHAQTTHRTVIQRDAKQIYVFPIQSFIPCFHATRELASYSNSYIFWIKPTSLKRAFSAASNPTGGGFFHSRHYIHVKSKNSDKTSTTHTDCVQQTGSGCTPGMCY